MSKETKQDVFEDMKWELIRNLANTIDQNGGLRPLEDATKVGENYATRYAAALPDDLPVIPLTVGEYIEEVKAHGKFSIIDPLWRVGDALSTMGESGLGDRSRWVLHHSDDFARAWLLGVWRVEETGEIVKLEAEK